MALYVQFIFVDPWQLDHSRNICTIATETCIWYDVFITEKESALFHIQLVLINFTHLTMFDVDRNLIISLQQKNEIMQYHIIFDQYVCNHASYTLLNFINEHHNVTCTDLYILLLFQILKSIVEWKFWNNLTSRNPKAGPCQFDAT